MKEIIPDYYHSFSCIASKCKHNCCIGWEIDIDSDTLELYECLDEKFKSKLEKNVVKTDDFVSFKLTKDNRCPFLKEDNLCQIISDYGDGALCDICAEHPRFYSFGKDTIRCGLGLCCEEAARIIISKEEKVVFENFEFLEESEKLFLAILQDRSKTVFKRLCFLLEKCDAEFERDLVSDAFPLLLSLERLDESWTGYLKEAEKSFDASRDFSKEFEIEFEQLAVYFFFRHFAAIEAQYCKKTAARFVFFCVFSLTLLCNGLQIKSREELTELSRKFSAEVEYSDENVDKVCHALEL